MKKKLLRSLTTFAMCLSLLPTAALAGSRSYGIQTSGVMEFAPARCLSDDYTDLEPEAWYHEAVDHALENGLMTGVGSGLFAPGAQMSRAMIVTILWSLEGKPSTDHTMLFTDVAAESWYTEAVRWAASAGIISGYSAETFAPNDGLTREQLATILYSYAKYKGGGFTGAWMFRLDYPDVADISEWAYEPICWMTMKNVMSGKDGGILDPKGSATRAETAQMLMRFLEG